ncbi:MAG: hypothetical protein OHK0041_08360 [Anaerolineales bacterium]
MNKSHRFLISVLLLGAYLLSACSGAAPISAPRQSDNAQGSQSTEVAFTGSVEAMDASQWTISGQVVGVEGASIDPNVKVGDIVKVEASVSPDGSIFALRIEASRPAGIGDNSNDNMNGNANDNMNGNANANDNMNGNANDNANANDNDNMNGNDNDNMNGNDNSAPAGVEREIYGVVEALSDTSVTVSGVTYTIASFTEFKTIIAVGDQVKLHVIAASDGSLVVREIERTTRAGDDNSNSNTNSNKNSNDDHKNSNDDNKNSNKNDNDDDHDDDHSNGNGNSNDND